MVSSNRRSYVENLHHLFSVDIVAIGKAVDQVGLSKEFQAMLVDASKLGTLDRS